MNGSLFRLKDDRFPGGDAGRLPGLVFKYPPDFDSFRGRRVIYDKSLRDEDPIFVIINRLVLNLQEAGEFRAQEH